MPSSLHQRIIAVLAANPQLAIALWTIVEPEFEALLSHGWIARARDTNLRVRSFSEKQDFHRLGDLVITLHPEDDPDGDPKFVLVFECQLNMDPRKLYVWADYLTAARALYEAIGRVVVMSPLDAVIQWAHGLFDDEPKLRPELIGRGQMPLVDDHGRALREPELAVLSAVFHGAHERGDEVLSCAALALRSLPRHKRHLYAMLLEDALPEEKMDPIRKAMLEEEARVAADAWMRSRGPYRIGHREGMQEGHQEGRQEGHQEGRQEGLAEGRREALAVIFELRGLRPSVAEQARIDACTELATLERWGERAKTIAMVAELFADD